MNKSPIEKNSSDISNGIINPNEKASTFTSTITKLTTKDIAISLVRILTGSLTIKDMN
jgi:hypothetical protein